MDFRASDPPISQPDPRAAFHLPPVAFAIQAPKPREIANASTRRDRLDVGEIANQFEVHAADRVEGSATYCGISHRTLRKVFDAVKEATERVSRIFQVPAEQSLAGGSDVSKEIFRSN
jgi:hypothetical protein